MTEQQPYALVQSYPVFELRRYPSHVVAEVTVQGSFEDAGSQAFRSLFGYISGQNAASQSVDMTAPVVQASAVTQESAGPEKIAMTAPVAQTETDAGDYDVAFVLPATMTAATAPAPTNPQVRIREVPERLAAVMAYSGRWTETSYRRHRAELAAAVAEAGLVPDGAVRFARFDPPYKPWFLRRNEVLQDVRPPEEA